MALPLERSVHRQPGRPAGRLARPVRSRFVAAALGGAALLAAHDPAGAVTFAKPLYADNTFTFQGRFLGQQAVTGADVVRSFNSLGTGQEWRLIVTVTEKDGMGLIQDTLEIFIVAQHLEPPVGPEHKKDDEPNADFWLFEDTIGKPGAYKPGPNSFSFREIIDHPSGSHFDVFGAAFSVFVEPDSENIASYDFVVTGTHVVPLPAALPLMVSAMAGFGILALGRSRA